MNMKSIIAQVVLLVIASAVLDDRAGAQDQPKTTAEPRPQSVAPAPIARFSGSVVVSVKGSRRRVNVEVRTFIIPNAAAMELPHSGDAFVNVRAGDLVAVIDGKRAPQEIDTSFVVPRAAKAVIETDRDSVVIEVFDVTNAAP